MTSTLTIEARNRLDHYLRQVRASLRGSAAVDADEVERDIREHIEAEIADREGPVSEDELEAVIRRLGAPSQWMGEGEVPAWRRVLARWHEGERWRLPYLALAASGLGLVLLGALPPVGLVLIAAGFVLARATVSLAEERGEELGARRWLVGASVAVVVVPVLLAVAAGPLVPLGQVGYEEGWFAAAGVDLPSVRSALEVPTRLGLVGAGLGIWWLALAALLPLLRRQVNACVRPLFAVAPGRARYLAAAGLLLAVAGLVVLALV